MTMTQRWLFRKNRHRPAHETIVPGKYDVAPVGAAVANAFVRAHHHAGTPVYDRYFYGLFHRGPWPAWRFSHPPTRRCRASFRAQCGSRSSSAALSRSMRCRSTGRVGFWAAAWRF